METLAIKIERCYEWEAMYSGRFKAYEGNVLDDCTRVGFGRNISEAIDSLLEQIEGEEVNYKWS